MPFFIVNSFEKSRVEVDLLFYLPKIVRHELKKVFGLARQTSRDFVLLYQKK